MLSWQCEAWKHEAAWTGLQKPVQHFQSLPSPISVSRALFTPGIISPSSSSSHSSSYFGKPESLLLHWHLIARSYLDFWRTMAVSFLITHLFFYFAFHESDDLTSLRKACQPWLLSGLPHKKFVFVPLITNGNRQIKFAQFSVSLCCFS